MSARLFHVGRQPSANEALFHGGRDAAAIHAPQPPGGGVLTAHLGSPDQSIQVHYAREPALPARALLHRLGLLHPLA